MERDVTWEGFANARDLGGMPLRGGGVTAPGRVFRSATPAFATEAGWAAAWSAGVRTVVDLRNDDEIHRGDDAELLALLPGPPREMAVPPAGMDRIRIPLDDLANDAWWDVIRAERANVSPLYYRRFLEAKAERCVDVVRAIAQARQGGVLVHCRIGRDRTGLVALLLLALAGVDAPAIADDFCRSAPLLTALYAQLGLPDGGLVAAKVMRSRGITARDAVLEELDGLDVAAVLRAGGLDDTDLAAARGRLLP